MRDFRNLTPLKEENLHDIVENSIDLSTISPKFEMMSEPVNVEIINDQTEEDDISDQLKELKNRAKKLSEQLEILSFDPSSADPCEDQSLRQGLKNNTVEDKEKNEGIHVYHDQVKDEGDPDSEVDVVTVDNPGDHMDHLILQNVRPSLCLVLDSSTSSISGRESPATKSSKIYNSCLEDDISQSVSSHRSTTEEEFQAWKNFPLRKYNQLPRRFFNEHRIFWSMPFRQKLFDELVNPSPCSQSDSEDESDCMDSSSGVPPNKDDIFLEEDNLEDSKEDTPETEGGTIASVDPIVFAPTGDIYSFFQRRRFEPDRCKFPLPQSTLVIT